MSLLLLLVCVVLFAALVGLARNERHRRDERAATAELVVGEEGVSRTLGDGRHEEVRWSEITEVEVMTTKVGVHRKDGALIVLAGDAAHGCLVPSGLAREGGLYEQLARLPGFDFKALADALDVRPPSKTTVWRRA